MQICVYWLELQVSQVSYAAHMRFLLVNGHLKSLSPIYFVKIRPPDFLCNEFLIKMYRLLLNYTFKICTLSKIMNIVVNTIFFTGRSLFTSDRKVYPWFRTHVHWFATVVLTLFSFSSLIHMDIKMFIKVYQQTL